MTEVAFKRRWHTVAEVAEMLGYGGDARSGWPSSPATSSRVKDGKLRRILPEWVDEYVALKVAESEGSV